MAKIKVVGEAAVIISEVKLDDIKKIARYRPCALALKDDTEKKNTIFQVGVSSDRMGDICAFGAFFGAADADGFATITVAPLALDGEDVKEAVAEKIGPAILLLNKLEETLPDVIEEIDGEHADILANIEIA